MFFQPDARGGARRAAQRQPTRDGRARLGGRGARAGATTHARADASAAPTGGEPAGRGPSRALGDRRRRRQLVRARGLRIAAPRPRLPRAVARRRRDARTTWTRSRPARRLPVVRPARGRRTHVRSGTGTGAGSSCCCPASSAEDFADTDARWELLAPWCAREDGRADAARRLRVPLDARRAACAPGAVLLVGDAAHLTPPFLGQGLCSGLRDAANVAWKLDLVLRGLAAESLLDTVDRRAPAAERVDHRARRRARPGALRARPGRRRRARRRRCARAGRAAAARVRAARRRACCGRDGDGAPAAARRHARRPGPRSRRRRRGPARRRRRRAASR